MFSTVNHRMKQHRGAHAAGPRLSFSLASPAVVGGVTRTARKRLLAASSEKEQEPVFFDIFRRNKGALGPFDESLITWKKLLLDC